MAPKVFWLSLVWWSVRGIEEVCYSDGCAVEVTFNLTTTRAFLSVDVGGGGHENWAMAELSLNGVFLKFCDFRSCSMYSCLTRYEVTSAVTVTVRALRGWGTCDDHVLLVNATVDSSTFEPTALPTSVPTPLASRTLTNPITCFDDGCTTTFDTSFAFVSSASVTIEFESDFGELVVLIGSSAHYIKSRFGCGWKWFTTLYDPAIITEAQSGSLSLTFYGLGLHPVCLPGNYTFQGHVTLHLTLTARTSPSKKKKSPRWTLLVICVMIPSLLVGVVDLGLKLRSGTGLLDYCDDLGRSLLLRLIPISNEIVLTTHHRGEGIHLLFYSHFLRPLSWRPSSMVNNEDPDIAMSLAADAVELPTVSWGPPWTDASDGGVVTTDPAVEERDAVEPPQQLGSADAPEEDASS